MQATLGVLIALFVLTQAVIVPDSPEHTDKQEQSDSQGESGEEQQQISKNEAVPSSTLQINLNYQSYLLNEVFFSEDSQEEEPAINQILPSAQKALKVLLRRIISPNAP